MTLAFLALPAAERKATSTSALPSRAGSGNPLEKASGVAAPQHLVPVVLSRWHRLQGGRVYVALEILGVINRFSEDIDRSLAPRSSSRLPYATARRARAKRN